MDKKQFWFGITLLIVGFLLGLIAKMGFNG